MSIETIPGFADCSEADKCEMRRFATYLRCMAAAQKRGEALAAPELLRAAIYGSPNADEEDGGAR